MWTETETKIGIRCELCVLFVLQGDTRVLIYEIVTDAPYFFECSSFSSPEPHKVPYICTHVSFKPVPSLLCWHFLIVSCPQGLAFLPKTECNVHDVEIAVGLMLTKSTVEPVAFRVPRVKVSQLHHPVDTCLITSFLVVISNKRLWL